MKRPILMILLLLAAGAIVNVAVAWTIRFAIRDDERGISTIAGDEAKALWRRYSPKDWPTEPMSSRGDWVIGDRCHYTFEQTDILWMGFPPNDPWIMHVIRVGWPCHSICGAKFYDTRPGYRLDGLVDAAVPLPFHPIWPGFAINTAFYAVVLRLLFAAPLALRRRRRIKRGLCPKCAYDLRGSQATVCTECGAAVRQKAEQ